MSQTLSGGGAKPKSTTSAGAAKPPIDLTQPMDTGHAMAPTDMGGGGAAVDTSSAHPTADPKKKKLDWQSMVKSGLNAASNSIDDQADPMQIMQQLQSLAASSRGQIIQ